MVYLRTKKVKGEQYLYLVHSIWDPKKSTSRQEIIKYLGKSSQVTKEDIPSQYQNDSKIVSFFSSNNKPHDVRKLINKFRKELLYFFKEGNLDNSLAVYFEYSKMFGTTEFYENILRPVMYDIGKLWETKQIDIAIEHICSNIAENLINTIKQKNQIIPKKQKVLLCTPVGENHCIGCHMIESFLSCKGFHVFNLSPSVPSESILNCIEDKKPDLVFVSITLQDNIVTGQRLVNKIHKRFNIPIVVGGQAIINNARKFDAIVIPDVSLNAISKLIQQIGRKQERTTIST